MTTIIQSLPSPAQVARAFLRPSTHGQPSTLDFLPGGERFWVDGPAGRIAASAAGSGPAVLLVHGWEGQARDFAAIAPVLLAAGLRVVAIDLPAHGDSEGRSTSIPASAQALLRVAQAVGPLRAVVAHSVGSAIAVEAMAMGMAVERAALLSAPARYLDYAQGFARLAGLDATGTEAMVAELKAMDIDVAAVAMPARAPQLRQAALFIHSRDDRVVPIGDAEESAGLWPGATMLRVDGLGHRRLLQDPQVVAAVASFVG